MVLELSPEERALLSNVLQGNTNAVIAQQLGITEAAAKGRLHHLLRKIGCRTGRKLQFGRWQTRRVSMPRRALTFTERFSAQEERPISAEYRTFG
jgi:DNA-binding NarL/FixJ family response regulator